MTGVLRGDELTACLHRIALSYARPELARRLDSSTAQHRRDAALELRRGVISTLTERHGPIARVHDESSMRAALAEGVSMVTPYFEADVEARRQAHAHLLIRTGRVDERFSYAPVLIKNQAVDSPGRRRSLYRTTLDAPWASEAVEVAETRLRRSPGIARTVLSLVHTLHALRERGHADPRSRVGVVDRERQLWWIDVSDPAIRPGIEEYDARFAERVDVLRGVEGWRDQGDDFPTTPWWHRECEECVFRDHCREELVARDDVSLVRFTTQPEQSLLRERGIHRRADLAAHSPLDRELAESVPLLPDLVYRARVGVTGRFLRKVGIASLGAVRADVEVDVDMESYDGRTYLWGAYVTTRTPVDSVTEGYFPFANWDVLDDAGEAAVFSSFWDFLQGVRRAASAAGASFAAYCFWAQAENGAMDRAVSLGALERAGEELAEFRTHEPPLWFDVHEFVRAQIQTEGPTGLKDVATRAGFAWRDEDPSGEASMRWYEVATGRDEEHRAAARRRLLEYNEDDCRATRALREWLDTGARDLEHRDEWTRP